MIEYDEMTREQLVDEVGMLRQRVAELEERGADAGRSAEHDGEDIFRQIVENSRDGIIATNSRGEIAYANEAAARNLGYAGEELLRLNIADVETGQSRQEYEERFAAVLRGERLDFETVARRKDGSLVDADVSLSTFEHQGEVVAYSIWRDTTTRKQAEEALQRERNLAQKYLDVAGVIILALDAEGQVTMMNPKGCEILGYSRNEMPEHYCDNVLGLNWFDTFLPERLRGEVRGVFAQLMAGDIEPVEYFENPVLTRSGEERIVAWHNTVLKDEEGRVVGTLGSGEDITERRRAEEKLRESLDLRTSILESISDGFFALDDHLKVTYFNGAAEKLLGRPREEVLGRNLFEAFPEAKGSVFEVNYTRAVKEKVRIDFEVNFAVQPYENWYDVMVYPQEHGISVYFQVTTERKRTEDLVRTQRDLGMSLSSAFTLDEGLRLCLEAAIQVSGMDSGGVYIVDEATGALDLVFHSGLPGVFVESASHYDADSTNARLVAEGNPIYSHHREVRTARDEVRQSEGLQAIAILPISHEDRVIACLNIASHTMGEVPHFARTALETIATRIGSAIARLRAEEELEKHRYHLEELVEERTAEVREANERLKEEVLERTRAEEELDRIFNLVPDMIAVASDDGYLKRVNHAWEEVLGHPTDDLLSRPFLDFIHPDDREPTMAEVERQLGGQPTIRFENRYVCRDGSYKWLEWVATPALEGNLLYAAARDVTERREMENEIRRLKDFYESILESIVTGVWVTGKDDVIHYANAGMAAIAGIPADQVCGARVLEDFPESTLEFFRPHYLRAKETLEPVQYEAIAVVTPAGRTSFQSGWLLPLTSDGNYDGMICTVEDITERQLAEDALRQTMRLNQILLDSFPCVALLLRPDTREIVASNHAAVQAGAVPGAKCFATWGQREDPCPWCLAPNAWATGEAQHLEVEGLGVVWDAHWIPVSEDLYMHFAFDVTERKRAEQELRLKNIVFESSITANSTADNEGIINHVNAAFLKMWGYEKREDAIGNPISSFFVNEEDAAPVVEALNNTGTWEGEFLGRKRDGSTFVSRGYATVVRNARGEQIGYQSSNLDVTAQRSAEEALQRREEHFRSLIENSQDAIVIVDSQGTVVYESPSIHRLLGHRPEERIGAGAFDLVHPDDLPIVAESFAQMLHDPGFSPNIEVRFKHIDGSWRILEGTGQNLLHNPSVGGIVVNMRDITERKQAEALVREMKESYDRLTDNADEAIFRVDAEGGHVVYVNAAAERIFGYSQAEWLGDPALGFKVIHPDSRERQKQVIEEVSTAKRTVKNAVLTWIAKDGREVCMEYTVLPVLNERGNVDCFESMGRDITERRRAEDEIRKFKAIADEANYGVAISDMEGNVTYANAVFAGMHGYSTEEFIGKHFSVCHNEEQLEEVNRLNEQLMLTGSLVAAETWHTRKDGSVFPILMNAVLIRDAEGEPEYMAATALDIAERIRADEKLRESEERLREAQRVGTVGDWQFDLDSAQISWSDEVFRLFERDPAQGPPTYEENMAYYYPEDSERLQEQVRRAVEAGEEFESDYHLKLASGRSVFQRGIVRVQKDQNGKVEKLFGVVQDITERKQMETELRQLYDEELGLRQKLETEIGKRVEFTRTLTHELKTPLTSVLASSDLLASEVKDPSLQSLAASISRSAANLNSRVDELLDLARGEIGMLELNLEEVEVSQLLREAAESVTPLASKREQSLAVDVPSALPIVQADAVRLQQVVGNLLNNAIKFTPKGGKITVRGRHEGAAIVVEVEDTGRGLSKEDQKRVFEPYHRLEGDRQRLSGLGLGLPLCKSLVELHGGQVWVRSAVGKGSAFCFSLPLDTADEAPVEAPKTKHLWKVLMIEDDPEIVNFVSTAFRMRWPEAQLLSTDQGEDGVDLVEREEPDIVVLDLGLPDTSGFEVLRQIRLFSAVPVVILTVRAEEDAIVRGLEWGADDYLVKPFRQMELLARLKVQLRKQTTPDEEAPIVCGPLRFDPPTAQLTLGGKEVSLTVVEGHIIRCLMINAGRVVTHARLAEAVWGEDYPGALDSLRVNIRRMRTKLEPDPKRPELILTKPGIGYMLAKPV